MVDSERVRALFGVSDCFAPAVSPSGDAVAYRVASGTGTELRLRSVETGADRTLVADLPAIDRIPLYWLPGGERLVSVDGTEDDQRLDLVARDGDCERLADLDGRAFPYDTEPGVAWYWELDRRGPTLYRHPVDGERRAVATLDRLVSAPGGVEGGRAVVTRIEDGVVAPHVVDVEAGTERRLSGAEGWAAHARPWIDGESLLLSQWGAASEGSVVDGIGVYDTSSDAFDWRDESVDRAITVLPNGDALAVRNRTVVVGGPDGWTERPVDGTAAVSPMAGDETVFPDGRAAVVRQSDTRPRELVTLDPESGDAETLVEADFGPLDPNAVVAPERTNHPTADGREVDGYLWRPDGAGPHPAVVTMYPASPEPNPGLDWHVQALVDAGYAVLFAGHRGDVLAAHRDYAAAGEWLADRPGVDGERVAFYGHSYGGEAALRQAFRHPDVWTAVVDWAGTFDLVWGLEEGALPLPWKASAFPDYDEDPETWREASPASHADDLDVPLLIAHGRRDPVISVEQSRRVRTAVDDDAPLEYHEFDTGHGGDLDGDTAVWTTILEFLERRL